MNLGTLAVDQVFLLLIIFARIGSALMVFPGIGDGFVSIRIRLLIALFISFLTSPIVGFLPAFPNSVLKLFEILLIEIAIGIFLGIIVRILLSVMQIVGSMIATQSGLSSAMLFDPTQNTQGVIVSSFMSILAFVLIFVSDLHHLFIKGFVDSYHVFSPGQILFIEEFSDNFLSMIREMFVLCIKMMAPQIVVNIVLLIAAGILSRLMPSLQIFFLITPVQLLVTFAIFMITLSITMNWYFDYLKNVAGYLIH